MKNRMSYEGEMLKKLAMPAKGEVEKVLLETLVKHNGTIKEFASGEEIVNELADLFSLNQEQRNTALERIYKKENRIVKTPVWHRLLYRAADDLAKQKLVTRPTATLQLTNKKEWMLTENGYDKAMRFLKIPSDQKNYFQVKSYEVQKLVNKIRGSKRPLNYNPLETGPKKKVISKEISIRIRGFRQAVIESYNCRCCICGLKIKTPDNLHWEVEAAHIVPHGLNGKDDIWNGIALCSLHHWAFDVGWFSLSNDFKIIISSKYYNLGNDFGKMGDLDFLRNKTTENRQISLPDIKSLFPHENAVLWHRENIFYK